MSKIVFELQIGLNLITNILEVLNCLIVISLSISKIIELLIKLDHDGDSIDSPNFVNFNSLQDAMVVTSFLIILATLFIPFRFFILCSHYNFFKPFSSLLNILFRILPGFITSIIIIMINVVVMSNSFYFLFSPFSEAFSTYGRSFISIIFFDFWNDEDFEFMTVSSPFDIAFMFAIVFVVVSRYGILVFMIIMGVFLYK